MAAPLIRICNLHYSYISGASEPIEALRGIDLDLPRGQWLTLIGHNGSGKSTLAKCLNGLLPPTEGEVRVTERDTRDAASLLDIRRTVGIVLQNPDNQFVASSVEEEVAFGPENLGLPRAELRARVDALLDEIGLAGRAHDSPSDLSAGEKSRLAVAAILALEPACLVLDESTAYLDALGRAALLALIRRRHAAGLTVLTVTHYLDEALLGERIVALRDGQVALDFAPHDIAVHAAELAMLDFELPASPYIVEGLRARGVMLPLEIIGVDEIVGALTGMAPESAGAWHAAPLCCDPITAPCLAEGSDPLSGEKGVNPLGESAGGSASLRRQDALLSIHDLAHTYLPGTPLARVALYAASLELARGEIHALVGPSGAGKSTLVRYAAALIRPAQRGCVHLLGQDVADPAFALTSVRRRVGLVFQYAHQQLLERYVGDDVAFGPRQLGLPIEAVQRRVREALEQVGLAPDVFIDRLTFALSGGEMRRVALAGVLAMEPEVLILDEATAGLDPRGRAEVGRLLLARRAQGVAILLVSNDMEEVAALADRVTVLAEGVTRASGPAREVLADAALLRACGLVAPTAAQLCADLVENGLAVQGNPILPDEAVEAIWQALMH